MIGRKAHGHHRSNRDAFAVGNDARSDLADGEDGALRRIDNGDKVINAEHTEIRDRESTTILIQREESFLLRLFSELATLLSQLLQR
jgi:hypothetical protein